ncbi:unnamed protein product, partial [Cyprideis torosa]
VEELEAVLSQWPALTEYDGEDDLGVGGGGLSEGEPNEEEEEQERGRRAPASRARRGREFPLISPIRARGADLQSHARRGDVAPGAVVGGGARGNDGVSPGGAHAAGQKNGDERRQGDPSKRYYNYIIFDNWKQRHSDKEPETLDGFMKRIHYIGKGTSVDNDPIRGLKKLTLNEETTESRRKTKVKEELDDLMNETDIIKNIGEKLLQLAFETWRKTYITGLSKGDVKLIEESFKKRKETERREESIPESSAEGVPTAELREE